MVSISIQETLKFKIRTLKWDHCNSLVDLSFPHAHYQWVFLTELQFLLQYFTGNLLSKNQQEVIFQENFVPVRVVSEICLDSNLYLNSDQTLFAFCEANPQDDDIDKCLQLFLDYSNCQKTEVGIQLQQSKDHL